MGFGGGLWHDALTSAWVPGSQRSLRGVVVASGPCVNDAGTYIQLNPSLRQATLALKLRSIRNHMHPHASPLLGSSVGKGGLTTEFAQATETAPPV